MKIWEKGIDIDKKIEAFTVGDDRILDLHLASYDILASKAHAQMLGKTGIIEQEESAALVNALEELGKKIASGDFQIEEEFEDVHSKIEFELIRELGDTGKKIHTARSRNDQVLTAMQLYLRDQLQNTHTATISLAQTLLELAETYKDVLLPGYTHLQIAMPSSFGLWFSAYAESLADDLLFLDAAYRVADQNPLGSAAGYGSSFPIDREMTTKELNFKTLKYNVVAAQMGRGKVEKSAAMAITSVAGTLSKLASDICQYLSQNFNFISFPDELTTGSSIMPHKKNPDVFELIRARCNQLQNVPGELTLLTTNLSSGYFRDLQMTKEIIIPAFAKISNCLEILQYCMPLIEVRKDILEEEKYKYLYSVEIVNQKVIEGMPFRDAYLEVAKAIEEGNFQVPTELKHTHTGSLGNLCLEQIAEKLKHSLG
jgi:argininosuccinate lyase